ncbi:hypothetical protein IFM89_038036 [Coptis chinensis]|uniref:RNase H type-1 domain-containing protein n=1 Tax=Coptis chinensis TaxID=261450 RepID=A0A835HV54_9MAGN|nr:hypothetical protein IFM89_038036 [Coptis chinensis]
MCGGLNSSAPSEDALGRKVSSLASSLLLLGKSSCGRGKLICDSIISHESLCSNVLKMFEESVKILNDVYRNLDELFGVDYTSYFHVAYNLLVKVREIVSWEGALTLFLLDKIDPREKPVGISVVSSSIQVNKKSDKKKKGTGQIREIIMDRAVVGSVTVRVDPAFPLSIHLHHCYRGVGLDSTRQELKNAITVERPSLVFVCETKSGWKKSGRLIRKLGFSDACIVPSQGLSGGLWLLWSDLCTSRSSNSHYTMGAITSVQTTIQTTVVVYRDLNEVLKPEEKRGRVPFSPSKAQWLIQAMNNCELFDIGYKGPVFTWCNGQKGWNRTHERIDRALANVEWRLCFPNDCLYHKHSTESDHKMLVIKPNTTTQYHPRPFRFEAFWLEETGCQEVIAEAWQPPGELRRRHKSNIVHLKKLDGSKKAWQLMEPNSIWASNVKSRYFPASSFMQARLPSTASPCLKNIWKMKPILSHGLIWKVGDGLSIDAWKDRWIPSLDSSFTLPPRPPECMYERVVDFINLQTRQWNWAVVSALWPSDGSSFGNPGPSGAGCLFRRDDGSFICAGSIPIPYATSLMAETFAIRIALRLASQLRIPLIVVETDSSFLCDLLNHQNSQVPWEIKKIVEDIWELISGIPQTLIQHCYRECNSGADCLARMGST